MCECGKSEDYDVCCARFIEHGDVPASAEDLMRSRYVAYVRGHIDYVATTQDFGDQPFDKASARAWSESATWIALSVVRAEQGGAEDTTGLVEFEARYILGDRLETLCEASRFEKREGRWIYLLEPSENSVSAKKLSRNGACPCGSGKKFKRCHG